MGGLLGYKKLTLKFGQNVVNNKGYIVVVVYIAIIQIIVPEHQ